MGYQGKGLAGRRPPARSERARGQDRLRPRPFTSAPGAAAALPDSDALQARIDRAARYGHNLTTFAATSAPGEVVQRVLTPAGGDLYDWDPTGHVHAGRIAPAGRYQKTGSVYQSDGDPQEYELSSGVLVAREVPSSSSISRAVFHAGASALRSPDVQSASSIFSAHPDQAHVIEGPSDLLGSIVADSTPRAPSTSLTRETFFGESPDPVVETQGTRSRGGRSDLIPALGTYPEIHEQIKDVRTQHHLSESQFADIVIRVHQRGDLSGIDGEVLSMAEKVARLVYGTESARSVSNIPIAPMSITAVATGLPTFTSSGAPTGSPMTFKSLFTGASNLGGGMYPPSMQKGVPAARREHRDITGSSSHYPGPVGSGPQRDELVSRTSSLVRKLVEPGTLSSIGRLQESLENQTSMIYTNTSSQELSSWEQQQEDRARNALKKLIAMTGGHPSDDHLRVLAEQYPDTSVGRGILEKLGSGW